MYLMVRYTSFMHIRSDSIVQSQSCFNATIGTYIGHVSKFSLDINIKGQVILFYDRHPIERCRYVQRFVCSAMHIYNCILLRVRA
jgi:hypothetical protein